MLDQWMTKMNYCMQPTTHMAIAAGLECLPWWLDSSNNLENYLKLCALTSNTLSVTVGRKIDPLLICTNPGWFPWGVAHLLGSTAAP
jgi:hypothetical protein